jgi:hypothetical protein
MIFASANCSRVTFKVVVALHRFGTVVRIARPLIMRRCNGPIA